MGALEKFDTPTSPGEPIMFRAAKEILLGIFTVGSVLAIFCLLCLEPSL